MTVESLDCRVDRWRVAGRRVLVTGNAGSGKSTLAHLLADALCLPYWGLDAIVWGPGWVKSPTAIRDTRVREIAMTPSWVVDGVSTTLLDAADTVVFLDYSRPICYWRALKRNLPHLFNSRPGLPPRCPELLVLPTLAKLIWRFPRHVRPQILERQRSLAEDFVHIRSAADAQRLLAGAVASNRVTRNLRAQLTLPD